MTSSHQLASYWFSTVHATTLAVYSVYNFGNGLSYSDFEEIVNFSTAYFLIDLILRLSIISDTLANKIICFCHHGGALFLLYQVHHHYVHWVNPFTANYLLLTEISTPFINFYHLSKYYSVWPWLLLINNMILVVFFGCVRVIGLFFVTLAFYLSESYSLSYFACLSFFTLLNTYWFTKICQKWRSSYGVVDQM